MAEATPPPETGDGKSATDAIRPTGAAGAKYGSVADGPKGPCHLGGDVEQLLVSKETMTGSSVNHCHRLGTPRQHFTRRLVSMIYDVCMTCAGMTTIEWCVQ